ncbi:MAG: cell division protein FtsL [Butyrivibrio sp.]|nr:cell division protein FtsL [Butyrivibrio sp.]
MPAYENDNLARLYVPEKVARSPRSMPIHDAQARKARKQARHMSLGSLLFLSMAMAAVACILTWYVGLQSEVQAQVKQVAALESRLNKLSQENDEAYSRAGSGMDLEEIKRIAIQEYGMVYASEGQVITYSDGGGNDYVRQLAPIP